MEEKRMGRPYKDGVRKSGRCEFRTTPEEEEKMDTCCKALGKSRAEILRFGLDLVYKEIIKK